MFWRKRGQVDKEHIYVNFHVRSNAMREAGFRGLDEKEDMAMAFPWLTIFLYPGNMLDMKCPPTGQTVRAWINPGNFEQWFEVRPRINSADFEQRFDKWNGHMPDEAKFLCPACGQKHTFIFHKRQ